MTQLDIEPQSSQTADLQKTAGRRTACAAEINPRGLSRLQAARYVGISPAKFDEMVRDGRMPRPKMIDARRVWDIKRLDLAFEALPESGGNEASPWDVVT